MSYLVAFICGASIYYISRFFPFLSLAASVVILVLFSTRMTQSAHHLLRRKALSILLMVLAAAAGFFYAHLRYDAPLQSSAVAGTTVTVKGWADSAALPLPSGDGAFLQQIEISEATSSDREPLPLKELRIISRVPLSPGRTYALGIDIPRDGYTLNPGSSKELTYGYVIAIQECPEASASPFVSLRAAIATFIKNNFSRES
jgi:hypothetical protein